MSGSDAGALENGAPSQSTLDRLAAEAKEMAPPTNHQKPRPPQTKDITTLFTTHTSNLPTGHLVKDDFFTLFEAVGALEIMDPKMDSGFIPPGDSFDVNFDVSKPLQGGEVLWVMDQLMCLEVEWLEGYPLSQTVFTSVHVARLIVPDNKAATFKVDGEDDDREGLDAELTHRVLRAHCVALIMCLEGSMQAIQSQTFYEEEDFVTHLFGRELLPQVSIEDALEMLDDAKAFLTKTKALSSGLRTALEDRLLFREQLLDALRGNSQVWENMLQNMDDLNRSHSLATPTPDAFSSKIQRQLATSTPPRPMLEVSWDQGITKWRELISHVVEAYSLTAPDITSDPQCLQRVVWGFAYRSPPPSTLPRAILQDRIFHEQGSVATNIGHYELFLSDLRNVVLAGDSLADPASFQVELPTDPRHIRARLLEGFVEKAFDEYLNLYRMVCQNRCRIRRLFTQAVSILDAMESEGARVDQDIMNVPVFGKAGDALQRSLMPLSSWAKFYKLRVTAWTVQMGFETDIYMNDELGSMYWFLSQLRTSQSRLVQHLDRHLKDRIKRKPIVLSDCLASQAYLNSTKLHADATQALASALSTLFFHMQDLSIIPSPKRSFSTPQLFHEARMKPYLTISNEYIPSAADFEKARRAYTGRPTVEICRQIDAEIKRAKGLLAELKKVSPEDGKYVGTEEQFKRDIKALETVCVAVAVNATQLGRLVEKFGREEESALGDRVGCSVEKRWSEWWVVPVIKERK